MTQLSQKIVIVTADSLSSLGKSAAGTVFCYGHFNVIHPGHIRFLQYAHSQGKHLTIAMIGDNLIAPDMRQHYFSEKDRANGLAALEFVDKVIILNETNLGELISVQCPGVLVLGKEYESQSNPVLSSQLQRAAAAGTRIIYHAGEIHYSSSDLLRGSVHDLEAERRQLFLQACKRQQLTTKRLIDRISKFSSGKLLVVGDTIVDQYVACDAIGMSAEAPVLVVKEIEAREFIGGAAVVAAHVRALGAQCTYLSVTGKDENANVVSRGLTTQGVTANLIADESRPTTFKIRYMVDNQKLFRVSRLKEHNLSKEVEEVFIRNLHKEAENAEAILVSDFVYGVITPKVLIEIQKIAREKDILLFGDLQCSSQVGDVAQFKNFHLICPTEREARIALSNQQDGVEWIANSLLEKTHSRNLIIKLGAEGFISYERRPDDGFVDREHFPALVSNPIDVAGAGDSLLAAMAVSFCAGASLMEASAIGACMAALAVQTIGNMPVSYHKLENFIRSLEQT